MRFSWPLSPHVYPAFANDVLWGPSLDTFQGRRWFRGWSRERVPFGLKKRNHILWDLAKCLALFFLLLSKGFAFFPSRSRRLLATLAAIIVLPSALLLGPLFSPPPSSRACSFFVRLSRLPSLAGLRRRVVRKNAKATWWESPRALRYIDFII